MSPTDAARLLPWLSADGKPCFVVGDGTGFVSRLADEVEEAQLETAGQLIEEASHVLDARTWTPGEIHLLAVELTASLANVRRVATSRGARLVGREDDCPDADDVPGDCDGHGAVGGPRLQAGAFG